MKTSKTHIDLLNDYYDSFDSPHGVDWSRRAHNSTRAVVNDLCSLSSDDYVGIFRYGNGKRNNPLKIYFFDERERLIFVCDKENDYERQDIDDPDHYIRSMIGINKYKI